MPFLILTFSFTDEVMYTQKQLGNNAENKHQRVQEHEALKTFESIFSEFNLQECGLFIDEELPFLGSSPFRLYGDNYIVSIKCPLKAYKQSIDAARMQFWKKKSGERTINKKSAWYFEVQGDLHVTKRNFAYLMIWLGENQYEVVKVKRDDEFFKNEMKEKLEFFYKEAMLKELANSRREREMELRKFDETTNTFL